MSETWRIKRYYNPRVLIPVSQVVDNPYDGRLIWLSGAETDLLRNLLEYAHRRSTFVSTYRSADYLAPDNEEWDSIESIVAELEAKLMTDCCQDILDALGAINDKLTTLNGEIGPMALDVDSLATNVGGIATDFPALVSAAQCVCEKEFNLQVTNLIPPDWADYPDTVDNFDWTNNTPSTTVPSETAEEACKLAQCWWQAGWETSTEWVLPAFRFGFDKLIPAAAAGLALITGGVAAPVAIGVYAFAELVQELLELAYDVAETNLVNWLYANRQDIVCSLYDDIQAGTTGSAAWANVQTELVEPAVELSAGDKVLIAFAFGIVAPWAAKRAQAQNSQWYQTIPEAGYCDACLSPPVAGDDWYAVPVTQEVGTLELNVTGSPLAACWLTHPDNGRIPCGLILQVTESVGLQQVKLMLSSTAGCPAAQSLHQNSTMMVTNPGWYYICRAGNHNSTQARDTLHAGATFLSNWANITTPPDTTCGAYLCTYGDTGHWYARVWWYVFTGNTPVPQPWY